MDINFDALAAPFTSSQINWRVGATTKDKSKGIALGYLDARDVMRRLDGVCGPANWQNKYSWSDGKTVVCDIGIRVGNEWIWKSNGAGDTDVEAEKGKLSDAFKRAAVLWGIGQYLYSLPNTWVALEAAGSSWKIASSELPLLSRSHDQFVEKYAEMIAQERFEYYQEIYAKSIKAIQEGIDKGELSPACEAWEELPRHVRIGLWRAPSRGGCFTTEQIKIMKSTEFRESFFGSSK